MNLFIQESGSSNDETILFLHGGGAAGWMWRRQVEALTDYHCLVPDLPEQGQSRAQGPFSIHGAAQAAAELVRARAHGGKAHVVGLSEGAQVAVALLAQAPDRVDHAVISSALLRPIPWASLLSPGMLRQSFRWSIPPFRNNDAWIRLNMRYSAGISEEYFPQFKQAFQEMSEDGFVHMMVENQSFRLPAGLGNNSAPTLVVVGKKEYAAMRLSAQDLAAALPGAKAYAVHHTRRMSMAEEHNWAMTTPELFTRTVRAWIKDLPLPGELVAL